MNPLPISIAELLALADAATQDVIDNQSCDCPIYAPGECAVCKAQAYRAARTKSPLTLEETQIETIRQWATTEEPHFIEEGYYDAQNWVRGMGFGKNDD